MFVTIATPFLIGIAIYVLIKEYKDKNKQPSEHQKVAVKQLSQQAEPPKGCTTNLSYSTLQTEDTVQEHPVEDTSLIGDSQPNNPIVQATYPVLDQTNNYKSTPPPTYWSQVNSNYHSITPYSGYQSPAPPSNNNQYSTTTYTMPSNNQGYVNYYTAPAYYTPMTSI